MAISRTELVRLTTAQVQVRLLAFVPSESERRTLADLFQTLDRVRALMTAAEDGDDEPDSAPSLTAQFGAASTRAAAAAEAIETALSALDAAADAGLRLSMRVVGAPASGATEAERLLLTVERRPCWRVSPRRRTA